MATIRGTKFRDSLPGTNNDDFFYGYEDADTFHSSRGHDTYDGGSGSDTVSYLSARSGVTVNLLIGSGDDGDGYKDTFISIENIIGSNYGDTIKGNDQANTLDGRNGNDKLFGFGGNDTLIGGIGNDELYGGADADTLYGDLYDDVLEGGAGGDTIYGGSGIDTISYAGSTGGVIIDLMAGTAFGGDATGDTFSEVENVTGSGARDYLTGNDGANVLKGGRGDDEMEGRGGADAFDGGEGTDTVTYDNATRSGPMVIDMQSSLSSSGEAAGDTFISIEVVFGSRNQDFIWGNDDGNVLFGGYDDGIGGTGGRDALYGRGGADYLVVTDNDLIADGGNESDTAVFLTSRGVNVTLESDGSALPLYNDGSGRVGELELMNIENLSGSRSADTLGGNNSNNDINGGDGGDVIIGGGGSDQLWGGEGADTFVFNDGPGNANQDDIIWDFEVGVDRIDLSGTGVQNFNDLRNGGDNDFMVQAGNDVIIVTSASDHTDIVLRDVQMSSLTANDFLF